MQDNIVVYIGDLVARAITVEWIIFGLAISIVCSILMLRASHALIWGLIASVAHVVVHATFPMLQAGTALTVDAVTQAIQAEVITPDWPVLAVEYCLYSFMIWIFYLSRIDLFRPWPERKAG